jgi:hypothetical protein
MLADPDLKSSIRNRQGWQAPAQGHGVDYPGSGTERAAGEPDRLSHETRALLKRGLSDDGYELLPIKSEHALAIDALPPIHGDPFDRILIEKAPSKESGS